MVAAAWSDEGIGEARPRGRVDRERGLPENGSARVVACLGLASPAAQGAGPDLWALKPVVRPSAVPGSASPNPIDAFLHMQN